MAITFVQSAAGAEGATTIALTGVGAGNLIVLFAKWEGATTGSITVSDGTSSLAIGTLNDQGAIACQFAYLLSANSGNKTYTVTFPASATFQRLRIAEFSHPGTVVLDVQNATGTGNSGSAQSGNITTTGADEVALGGWGETAAANPSSPLINGVAADGHITQQYASMWYKIFTNIITAASAQITISVSSQWVCNVISLKVLATAAVTGTATASITEADIV